MDRRRLLAGAALLPLAACGGGQVNIPQIVDRVSAIPEQVVQVAALIERVGAGLQGGLAKAMPAVGEVGELVGTINAAVSKVKSVASAAAAAPVVQQVTSAIQTIWQRVSGLGGVARQVADAALSLVPDMQGLVGLLRPGARVARPMPSEQALAVLAAAAAR